MTRPKKKHPKPRRWWIVSDPNTSAPQEVCEYDPRQPEGPRGFDKILVEEVLEDADPLPG